MPSLARRDDYFKHRQAVSYILAIDVFCIRYCNYLYRCEWQRLQYQGGGSRKALESFLGKAYGCCSTFSVSRETEPRKISEVQPGDVLVYPARSNKRLGHALIVVDVARKGEKGAIMCAEGNTPAREAHIVRNLKPLETPWFFFDGDESALWVSVFHFGKNELRFYYGWLIFAYFAANLANFAETKSWYGASLTMIFCGEICRNIAKSLEDTGCFLIFVLFKR